MNQHDHSVHEEPNVQDELNAREDNDDGFDANQSVTVHDKSSMPKVGSVAFASDVLTMGPDVVLLDEEDAIIISDDDSEEDFFKIDWFKWQKQTKTNIKKREL